MYGNVLAALSVALSKWFGSSQAVALIGFDKQSVALLTISASFLWSSFLASSSYSLFTCPKNNMASVLLSLIINIKGWSAVISAL